MHLIKSWGTGITNCALLMILYCSCSCFMVLSYTVIMSNNIVIPCANTERPHCSRRLLPACSYIIVYFLGQHSEIHLDNVIVIVGDGDNDNDNDNTENSMWQLFEFRQRHKAQATTRQLVQHCKKLLLKFNMKSTQYQGVYFSQCILAYLCEFVSQIRRA